MIKDTNNVFALETKNTSYIFYADNLGLLQHLYYGSRIDMTADALLALTQKSPNPLGCSTGI